MPNTKNNNSFPKRPTFTLSETDTELLRGLDADIEHAKYELERAKGIGIDVTELEKQLHDAVVLRDKILRTYSPKV